MADRRRLRIAVTDPEGLAGPPRVVTLPVLLGRDPERVEVEIADRMVSRRHARLEAEGDDVVLVDLESGNGTWIGEERVDRRRLTAGEQITLGTSTVAWNPLPVPLVPGPKPTAPPITRSVPLPGQDGTGPAPFGSAWGVVVLDGRLRAIPLRALYGAWGQTARAVAALPGLLAADHADPAARLDAHEALNTATDALLDGKLAQLGSLTFAFSAPDRPVDAFASRVPRMRRLADHTVAREGVAALRANLDTADAAPTTRLIAAEDRRVVSRLLTGMRDGVTAFRTHGGDVIERAGTDLEGVLKNIFVAFAERDQQIAAHLRVAEGASS